MKTAVFLIALTTAWVAASPAALAVTIRNAGAEAQTVKVTENGEAKDIAVPANSDVQACPAGCFLTFSSGDLLVVEGGEVVLIEGGKARIVSQ
ncbi:MAG: hypothetical protein AAF035_06195 [Pseudomonadota bacterium]